MSRFRCSTLKSINILNCFTCLFLYILALSVIKIGSNGKFHSFCFTFIKKPTKPALFVCWIVDFKCTKHVFSLKSAQKNFQFGYIQIIFFKFSLCVFFLQIAWIQKNRHINEQKTYNLSHNKFILKRKCILPSSINGILSLVFFSDNN